MYHTRHGTELFRAGEVDDASRHFGAANSLTPDGEGILQSLGVIREAQGKKYEAQQFMLRVLKINPKNMVALTVLGNLAAERDNIEKASDYMNRAAKANPNIKSVKQLASKFGKEADVEKGFVTRTKGNFRVQYQAGKKTGVERSINTVFGILEQARRELYLELLARPTKLVTVVVYTNDQYRRVRSTHTWAGAYFDGKIRVAVTPGTALQGNLRRDLRHELTHAFLYEIAPKAPLWVHEGYAQMVEGRSVAKVTAKFRDRRQKMLEKEVFLNTFAQSKHIAVVQRGYEQSLMAVGYLHRIGSKRQFRAFLSLVGRGVDSDAALKQVYRFDVETMLKRAALKR